MLSTQWQGQRPTEGPAIHYREANAIRQVKEILVLEKGSCVCVCVRMRMKRLKSQQGWLKHTFYKVRANLIPFNEAVCYVQKSCVSSHTKPKRGKKIDLLDVLLLVSPRAPA